MRTLQGTNPQSIDAELALQKKLAKQLGIKSKSAVKKTDPADNLDEFLTGSCLPLSCFETFLHTGCSASLGMCKENCVVSQWI